MKNEKWIMMVLLKRTIAYYSFIFSLLSSIMKLRAWIVISMIAMISVSMATEIRFFPDSWEIQKWCLVAVDVMIDTSEQAIAATDVVIETSLEYVDFVPNKKLLPNFLPPKVSDYSIHIIWFVSNSKETVKGSGSIGTLFLKQKNTTDADGNLKLYFAWPGKTYDSNLSILWWIDILEKTGEGLYRFAENASCEYPIDYTIEWWFAHMSADKALNKTIKKLQRQERLTRRNILPWAMILIIITLLFIYRKRKHWWEEK